MTHTLGAGYSLSGTWHLLLLLLLIGY